MPAEPSQGLARVDPGPDVPLAHQPRSVEELERIAKVVARSEMFADAKTPERAAVKMLFAMTMGFAPIAGLTGVDIIEGNPTPNAHFWTAAIEASPLYDYEVAERTNEKCTIRFLRRDDDGGWRLRGEVTWTLEDAKRAGLSTKANWLHYPRAMLWNRAMTEGGRAYCPGLFGGVRAYDADELGSEATPPPGPVSFTVDPGTRVISPGQLGLEDDEEGPDYRDRIHPGA